VPAYRRKEATVMPDTVPPRRWLSWRTVLAVGLCALGGAFVGEVAYILLGWNLREVVPGQLYRSALPTRALLVEAQRRHGIRTVLCLRGVCESEAACREEVVAAEELGLSFESLGLSAGRFPSPQAARELCAILDNAPLPLLVHCQRGIDRTGLVCALYLLLRTDATLERAHEQLSLRYLHLNLGRTRALDSFLGLYGAWLQTQGVAHSPDELRHWLRKEYRPPQGLAQIELLARLRSGVLRVPRHRASVVPVRVWNRAPDDLRLVPAVQGGLHLRWTLFDPARVQVVSPQPGGLRRATVAPDASVDLNVYLPELGPGRYHLVVELYDEKQGSFCQLGSDPLFVDVEVP
jgi:predicted protein tyrosine phosphatase